MSIFKGKNISLRALEPEDLEYLYLWENDTEVWWLGNTLKPYSKDTLRKYLSIAHLEIFENKQVRFAICLNEKPDEALGLIDLFDFDPQHQRAGVGILIGSNQMRNKGYGSEALSLISKYAFTVLFLHQLYCTIPEKNQASQKLFTKAGFQETGIRKEWLKSDEGWTHELFYQLLASDWASRVE